MNNTRIALQLLRHGIITDGDEMKSNPLLFAIKIGSRELVEELMTKHRHLVAVYTNEYVKNYTILDIAKRYKNDQIIQTVKNIYDVVILLKTGSNRPMATDRAGDIR